MFRDSFFIEQLCWLLFNSVLASENNFKKKKLVERLIAFALIGLYKYKRLQAAELPQ